MWIFVQALGFMGIAVNVVSVQFNKHWQIVLLKALSEFLFGLQYFFLKAYVGMVMDLISVLRNVIFTVRIKKGKSNKVPIILFTLFAVAAGISTTVLTWNETVASMTRWTENYTITAMLAILLCTLAITAKSLSTIAYGIKEPHKIRMLNLPSSVCWVIYNTACLSVAGAVSDMLTIISIAIAEMRYKSAKPAFEDENRIETPVCDTKEKP